MRLVFAGTPEFARVALEALHAAGHQVVLVLTQPDRPAGRGMRLQPSPVKQWALDHECPVAQPRSLRLDGRYPDDAEAARRRLQDVDAEAMIVAAYGLILPQWVLDHFSAPGRLGCLNIHGSLLPRWRGAAPIHRAIEAGDTRTGVTIMQMDAGLDTGDMLLARAIDIGARETTGQLHDRLAVLGGQLMVEVLDRARAQPMQATPQPAEGVTYASKIDKAEARLDWSQAAVQLERRIRAFDPVPGASTNSETGEVVKLWAAEVLDGAAAPPAPPGTVLSVSGAGIDIACGQGVLRLTALQRAGGKRLPVAAFLAGHAVPPGVRWGVVG